MKRLGLLFLLAVPAMAQVTPPAVAAYVNGGSGWNPWSASSGFGALGFTPPAVSLYCQASVSAPWTPCNPSGGGGSGTVTGTGTANTVAKWTSTTAIGNSSVTDDGSKVTVSNPLILSGSTNGELDLTYTGSPAPAAPTNSVQITVKGAVATPYSVGMPTAQGTGALTNDGSGNLTWSASGSGALINITSAVTASGCTVSSGKCVVSSSTPTVTFSVIPGTYVSLKIIGTANSTNGTGTSLTAQFNGDSGSNYLWQQFYTYGATTAGAASAGSVNHMDIGPLAVSGNGPGSFDLIVPNYTNTTNYKIAMANGARADGGVAFILQNYAGMWQNTAAITSIAMTSEAGGNIAAGSTFSIYGVQ